MAHEHRPVAASSTDTSSRAHPGAGRPWHRRLDHASDLELELGASDLGGLLAEAGRALAQEVLGSGAAQEATGGWRELEVRAGDRESLLVAWLNELLFVAETSLWVPSEFEALDVSSTAARMRARGVEVESAPSLVKAATHHGLAVRDVSDGLVARVILDL